jgi:hypothetical protein
VRFEGHRFIRCHSSRKEQDRYFQRKARERTKNCIAYLEDLVNDLKKRNATDQLEDLWKQRDEIAAERNSLAENFDAVERLLQKRNKSARESPNGSLAARPLRISSRKYATCNAAKSLSNIYTFSRLLSRT